MIDPDLDRLLPCYWKGEKVERCGFCRECKLVTVIGHEHERLRTELSQVRERVQEYEAACESEGLPKDAPVSRFVEHHRNNAGMEFAAEIERLRAEVERLRIAEGDAVASLSVADSAARDARAERNRIADRLRAVEELRTRLLHSADYTVSATEAFIVHRIYDELAGALAAPIPTGWAS